MSVYHLIGELLADGQTRAAHHVRRELLGTDDDIGPNKDEPHHPELYEKIVEQGQARAFAQPIEGTATGDGITISCRGESACLTATEARDLAARIARTSRRKDFQNTDIHVLWDFLIENADRLEGSIPDWMIDDSLEEWKGI